jgi:hypothetical protein
MSDLHVRLLRQVARIRRRQLRDTQDEPVADDRGARMRHAENAQSRADARLAATMARRRLEAQDEDSGG